MISALAPPVDKRDTNALVAEFLSRRPGYLPRWNPPTGSAGAAVAPVFARLIGAVLERLNQAPGKDRLAMLDLLGLRLVPAQPARAPIVFSLTQGSSDVLAPEGTQVAAPPPPGSTQQIVFSTEEDAAVAAAQLSEVFSLWPGRDEYINHSASLTTMTPFTLFQNLQLQPTEHILYLAHSKYLAFAGTARLKVTFDLAQGASSPLQMAWEYWDGAVWRGFDSGTSNPLQNLLDGTSGLSASGSVQLTAQGAQSALTAVNGISSYWIRTRLTQALLPDPNQILPEAETIRLTTIIEQDFESLLTASFGAPTVTRVFVQVGNNAMPGTQVNVQVSGKDIPGSPFTSDGTGTFLIPQPLLVNTTYTFAISGISIGTFPASAPFANILVEDGGPSVSGVAIVSLTNGAGSGLVGAQVTINDSGQTPFTFSGKTDANGNCIVTNGSFAPGDACTIMVIWQSQQATCSAVFDAASGFEVDLAFTLHALRIDKAFSDGKSLDVTKAFLPFGQLPQIGSAFYFKQAEAFTRSGATVRIFANAISPDDPPTGAVLFTHIVAWEYWNGFEWVPILAAGDNPDFTSPEMIEFVVPNDMASTKVNNEDGLWVRVRIAGGRFGYLQTLTLTSVQQSVSFPVVQAPVLADLRVSYTWQNGPFPLEQVFTYNDFQYADYTSNAHWPGNPFLPYHLLGDVTPAVYLGFTRKPPVDNYGLYFDIAEQAGVISGPELLWEYWNGGEWAPAPATDGTSELALAGMITFLPPADAQPLARFDVPLYWFRGRLKEDAPPNESTINRIYNNAVWASQWQTFTGSPLGASTGAPSQIFQFNQVPILPGQEIEVEELSGARANTEWRGIAMQVTPDDPNIVSELELLLAAEGSQTDIIKRNVHLVRDKTKTVTAVWIQWSEVENFFSSEAGDRIYVLDHALGRLFFGDGTTGMTPPPGAAIRATSFRSGGGLDGNIRVGTIAQLLGSVPGVNGVTNPRAAEGGADGETLEQFQQRAPSNLRNRGRAIVPADYEALAQQASAGVALARAYATLDASGIARPGWVTVMIIPQSTDPQPTPSAGLRQDVLNALLACAPADVAAAQGISVIGPTYLPVDVTATIAPADPAKAGEVEQAALKALADFLNPLSGGPGGGGWTTGRALYLSDIAGALGDVSGVDYVQDLALYVNGALQGDQVSVPRRQIVAAGQFQVSLVLPVGG